MKEILKTLKIKIPLKKGIFYSLVEFYFSGITPSSTGGQPVQLYYMTKDKIPVRKSYITLLLNTIYFKLVLLILGILALILKPQYIFNYSGIYQIFFVLGFIVDIVMIIFCYMLIFKQKYIKGIINWVIKLSDKTKILKSKTEKLDINELLRDYKEELKCLKNKKSSIIKAFILTFIQRLTLFSVAYIIYRSLGFNSFTYLDLLMIQVCVGVASESLPLPGGTGLSEKTLQTIFITIFGVTSADLGMLLTRTFSFYIPLIVSGLIILAVVIIKKHQKQKKYN